MIWLTTVGADGTPQPNPVWYLWDGATFLTYNLPNAARVRHIRSRPRVSLNFDGNGAGGDIVVITGTAEISSDPAPDKNPEYVAKYRERIARVSKTPERFAALYSVPIRIRPDRVRGF